jgi:ABC-type Fe2+-enterobactin transport system substrate-binding protein
MPSVIAHLHDVAHRFAPHAADSPFAHRPSRALTLTILIAGVLALASPLIATSASAQAPQLCKPGHNYDQAKGLCYDPGAAYKADIPKSENATGGILSGIGSGLGLGGGVSLCQYGDKHVGSGDQAYCVSRRTGQAYPAGR